MHPLLQEHPPPLVTLPQPTQSLLRSSTILPSLPALLLELAHNALDAHPTRLTATVDLDTWTLKLDDNGTGISRLGLEQLASGGRYSTSKLDDRGGHGADRALQGLQTYGFRGEAFASIADVATLEIRTRAKGEHSANELILREGDVLACGESSIQRGSQGTTVWVRDIFWKFPVRRRPFEKPSTQSTLLSSLRTALSQLALVHPSVSFSLVDTTSSTSLLPSEGKTLLQLSRATEGLLGRWRQLYGRAGVEKVWEFDAAEEGGKIKASGFFSLSAAHSKAGQQLFVNSRPLSASSSPFHKLLNTLISSSSFTRHASSHLSLPSPSPASTGTAATGGRTTSKERQSPKKSVERYPVFLVSLEVPTGWVDASLEPEKKVVEFTDPTRVTAFLTALTKRFLFENGFAHISAVTAPVASSPRPNVNNQPRKRRAPSAVFPTFPASTKRPRSAGSPPPLRSTPPPPSRSAPPIVDPSSTSHPSSLNEASSAVAPVRWVDPQTRQVYLVDTRTGNSWKEGTRPDLEGRADAEGGEKGEGCQRCGLEVGRGGGEKRGEGIVERGWLRRSLGQADGARGRVCEVEKDDAPEWLKAALSTYTNPIFAPVPAAEIGQARIPSLPTLQKDLSLASTALAPTLSSAFSFKSSKSFLNTSSAARQAASNSSSKLTASRAKKMNEFFASSADASSLLPAKPPASASLSTPILAALSPSVDFGSGAHLTRDSLARAQFIAQIDRKFLLCLVPSSSSTASSSTAAPSSPATLLLLDQHATSERIRVEHFWAQLAGRIASGEEVEMKELKPCVGVVVGREEEGEVRRWEGEFERWGIRFAPDEGKGDGEGKKGEEAGEGEGDYAQVWITHVPALLSQRLQAEGRTCQELVRSYLAVLKERNAPPCPLQGSSGDEEGQRSEGEGMGRSWTSVVREAPPVVLELVNSKACRGAVMFGDELAPSQASSLLTSLASTRFPFQCAHGRPSLVPLVNLPTAASSSGARTARGAGEVDWSRFS